MQGMKGERVLMRIHIGEADQYDGEPLYQAIVNLLRERHYAGATVLRGVLGFGAHARVHTTSVLRLSVDLPVVIECIESEENIEAVLPQLDQMIGGGVITIERARVIMYRADLPEDQRTGSWPIDLTGDWRSGGDRRTQGDRRSQADRRTRS